jgi:excisionase family DNA binding protein
MKCITEAPSDAPCGRIATRLTQADLRADGSSNGGLVCLSAARALSIADFCRLYGVGRTTTYAQIKAGALKARKIGRRTVVPVEAAEAWLISLSFLG